MSDGALVEDINTTWVLIPWKVDGDGSVLYKKCRSTKFVQKVNRWGDPDEILAMYADFVHDKNEGIVKLEPYQPDDLTSDRG